jgi:hypothetical protein
LLESAAGPRADIQNVTRGIFKLALKWRKIGRIFSSFFILASEMARKLARPALLGVL